LHDKISLVGVARGYIIIKGMNLIVRRSNMMHLSVQDSGTLGILTLRGNLAECHAEELRECLVQAFDRVNRLIVNCEKMTSLDTFFIRQLCAAYRVSRMTKKEITLAGDGVALIRSAVQSNVFFHCEKAGLGCEKKCFWSEI
jgi:anti-anti-sigma regulatory factor